MKLILSIICVLLISCGQKPQLTDVDLVEKVDSLDLRQIDTLQLTGVSAASYERLTDYAEKLIADTGERTGKGHILLAVASTNIKNAISNKEFDPANPAVKALLSRYSKRSYFIYQPKVPDFLKLMKRSCNGDYAYIMGRFRQKWYFYPSMIMLAAVMTFSLASLIALKSWEYRRPYNIFFCTMVVLIITACIVFKKTCDKNVTEDSFYGIAM